MVCSIKVKETKPGVNNLCNRKGLFQTRYRESRELLEGGDTPMSRNSHYGSVHKADNSGLCALGYLWVTEPGKRGNWI